MDVQKDMSIKLQNLEERCEQLQGELGTLVEMCLTLEMTVEQLVARGAIPGQQMARRIGFALDVYRNQGGPAVACELSKMQDSMLDAQLEAFDEEELPCA